MPARNAIADEEDLEMEAPTSIDPYAVLSLSKDATSDQVKSAYRKAALKHHPDKVALEDKESANTKFQEIAFAYAILSDERRRKRYDVTGRTEDSMDIDGEDFNWTDYFHDLYEQVTEDKINDFSNEYKGSEEERQDILKYYDRCKGNMDKLYQNVMLSDAAEDEERFRAIIDQAVEEGEAEEYAKYVNETEKSRTRRVENAKKRKQKEAKEAEKHAEDLGLKGKAKSKKGAKKEKQEGGDDGALEAMIQQRQKGRAGNFLADLEAKYAPQGKRGMGEPPEEAFAQTEARRKNKRAKKA